MNFKYFNFIVKFYILGVEKKIRIKEPILPVYNVPVS